MTGGGAGRFAFVLMRGDRPSFVILGLTQDPGLRAVSLLALGPDFRQDDGGGDGAAPVHPGVASEDDGLGFGVLDAREDHRFPDGGIARGGHRLVGFAQRAQDCERVG